MIIKTKVALSKNQDENCDYTDLNQSDWLDIVIPLEKIEWLEEAKNGMSFVYPMNHLIASPYKALMQFWCDHRSEEVKELISIPLKNHLLSEELSKDVKPNKKNNETFK